MAQATGSESVVGEMILEHREQSEHADVGVLRPDHLQPDRKSRRAE